MAEGTEGRHRHFILEDVTYREEYRSPRQGGGSSNVPGRNRSHHGRALLHQIDELQDEADLARKAQQDAGIDEGVGLQVEFESFPDIELAFERLDRERSGIELRNVRHDQEKNRTLATVFVPDGKLEIFENQIKSYLDESKDTKTGAKVPRIAECDF